MERNKAKPDPFRVMRESSIKDMLPRYLEYTEYMEYLEYLEYLKYLQGDP